MYEYDVNFVRVVDGDTIVVDIDLGFGIWIHKEHVRLARINCPESRTRDLDEKRLGLAAKFFVLEQIKDCIALGGKLTAKTFKAAGKYGRFIAEIYMHTADAECINLNDKLVETGHAVYVEY